MASKAYEELKNSPDSGAKDVPKSQQLVRMLSFRVVPAYYREIEKVANHKKMTVSKLIRSYIKEGMKRDKELTGQEEKDFRVE